MKITAVIFDLGGTLVEYAGTYDSWPDLETPGLQAAYAHLQAAGLALPPFDTFREAAFEILPGRWRQAVRGKRNLTVPGLLEHVLERCEAQLPKESQLQEAAGLYEQAIRAQAYALPHGAETLAWLHERGYRLGLISNTMFSGRAHIEDLERLGLLDYFDALLFSADEGVWKPNAALFERMLDRLEVRPQQAVYVGDDPAADVVGGQAAGMRTIHYPSTGRFPLLDGVQADATIRSLAELPAVLAQL